MRHDSFETYAESFGLLANSRRLHALLVLRERDEPATVPTLAEEIAEREHWTDDVPEEVVGRVRVALRHVHVPKLRDADVVAYDPESERIELSSDEAFEHVLDTVFDG